jgi:hypothetical protein
VKQFRLILLIWLWAAGSAASAQGPVAIVEDVDGSPGGVGAMDYLDVGRVIELGAKDSLILSYLTSCMREVIHGGVVTVGREQSETRAARVERAKVDCDGAKMMAAPGQNVDAAGMILRGEPVSSNALPQVQATPDPEFTLYGSSPVIELNGDGPLVIGRLDAQGEYLKLSIDHSQLKSGRFLDLADQGQSLTAGGVYGARWNKRLVVFRIDPSAKPGKTPIVGRLIRLGFSP